MLNSQEKNPKNIFQCFIFFLFLGTSGAQLYRSPIDFVICLDGSGSLDATEFTCLKNIADDVITEIASEYSSVQIGSAITDDRIAILQFGTYRPVTVESDLGSINGMTDFHTAIQGIVQHGGSTNTDACIEKAASLTTLREDAFHLLIVYTDGCHNGGGNLTHSITYWQGQGYERFAAVIEPHCDDAWLIPYPSSANYFTINDVCDLDNSSDDVIPAIAAVTMFNSESLLGLSIAPTCYCTGEINPHGEGNSCKHWEWTNATYCYCNAECPGATESVLVGGYFCEDCASW